MAQGCFFGEPHPRPRMPSTYLRPRGLVELMPSVDVMLLALQSNCDQNMLKSFRLLWISSSYISSFNGHKNWLPHSVSADATTWETVRRTLQKHVAAQMKPGNQVVSMCFSKTFKSCSKQKRTHQNLQDVFFPKKNNTTKKNLEKICQKKTNDKRHNNRCPERLTVSGPPGPHR